MNDDRPDVTRMQCCDTIATSRAWLDSEHMKLVAPALDRLDQQDRFGGRKRDLHRDLRRLLDLDKPPTPEVMDRLREIQALRKRHLAAIEDRTHILRLLDMTGTDSLKAAFADRPTSVSQP